MTSFNEVKIDSELELPYPLIDVENSGEHFVFQFVSFDKGQTDYSIENGGITGQFGIKYTGKGMNCDFLCDITIGNVRDFVVMLEDAYDNLNEGKAELSNYGSLDRSYLSFTFDKRGRCEISGRFDNKENMYNSGIRFSFSIDQSYISSILHNADHFFEEIYRLQGHNRYY